MLLLETLPSIPSRHNTYRARPAYKVEHCKAEARLQQRELAGAAQPPFRKALMVLSSLLRNTRLRYSVSIVAAVVTLILGLVYLAKDGYRPEPRGLDAPKSLLASSTSSGTRDIPTLGVAATEAEAGTSDMQPLPPSTPLPSPPLLIETKAQTPEVSPSCPSTILSSEAEDVTLEAPSLHPSAVLPSRPPPPALMNSTFALKRYPKDFVDVFVAAEY